VTFGQCRHTLPGGFSRQDAIIKSPIPVFRSVLLADDTGMFARCVYHLVELKLISSSGLGLLGILGAAAKPLGSPLEVDELAASHDRVDDRKQ
jgi:hypothetical protein